MVIIGQQLFSDITILRYDVNVLLLKRLFALTILIGYIANLSLPIIKGCRSINKRFSIDSILVWQGYRLVFAIRSHALAVQIIEPAKHKRFSIDSILVWQGYRLVFAIRSHALAVQIIEPAKQLVERLLETR